ncbi:uncharacterized protein [Palaemon carinicauda]|uniref:uncharacterized protein n=1 Tax=Palaemon carinicauda TaxID=392227 RepID=UPI0035B5E17D
MSADDCSHAFILYDNAIRQVERLLSEVPNFGQSSTKSIQLQVAALNEASYVLQSTANEYYKEINGQVLMDTVARTENFLTCARHSAVELTNREEEPPPVIPQPAMPKIPIPEFDGKVEQWLPFWTIFKAVVHDRKDMNDVVKFTMLNGYLRGRAREAIAGLAITPANYAVALDQLQDRFSNAAKLEQSLRRRLLDLPRPQHDADQLTDFLNAWNNVSQQLVTLTGQPGGGPYEKEIVIRCLSAKTKKYLYHTYRSNILSIDEVRDGIKMLIAILGGDETCDPPSGSSNSVKGSPYRNKGPKNEHKTHSPNGAFRTNVQATPKKHTLCCFCQGEHSGKLCTKYATLDSRRARIYELQLCFGCLRKGHRSFECTSRSNCFKCNGKHHTFLCVRLMPNPTSVNVNSSRKQSGTRSDPSRVDNNSEVTVQSQTSSNTTQQAATTSNQGNPQNNANSNRVTANSIVSLRPTALPTATFHLTNGENQLSVRAFLDSGSQRTFINPEVVEQLNLVPIKRVGLTLIPFGDKVETKLFDVVRVKVQTGTKRIKLNAVVCDHVNTSIYTPGLHKVYLRLQERGVKLADRDIESDTLSDIGLIIGADYYNAFVYCQSSYDDIGVINSTAGAVIFGPMPKWACNVISVESSIKSLISTQSIVCSKISAPVNPLDDDISRLWSLDAIGIGDDARTYSDQATIEHFSETIVKDGNKYTVDLPFRNDARPPTGYRKALGQLYSLKKAFQSKPELFDQYQSVLDEYVKLGFIEEIEVEDDSFHPIDGINHYLPHHPVFKESATTPIRIVFNASSKESQQAKSLNDCLHAGPNLAMKLTDMLVEFRQNKYAVVADISKAFLRIGINESHRDFTRFLWFADREFKHVKNFRFKVLLFGATCSPFLLNQTIQHHLKNHSDPIASSVMKSFYVDNFMKTYENCDDLELESHKVNQIMLGANMPLGEWASNLSSFNDRHTPDTVD